MSAVGGAAPGHDGSVDQTPIDPSEDPGWRSARPSVRSILIPRLATARAARETDDRLVTLRMLFVSFSTALALVGVIVVVLYAGGDIGGSLDAWPTAAVLALTGSGCLLAARTVPKPLECTDAQTLALGYQTRFFLRLAFSESPALLGFVGFILTGNPLLYPLGAAFSAAGFAWLAPTRANLAADELQLAAIGCPYRLTTALRGHTEA